MRGTLFKRGEKFIYYLESGSQDGARDWPLADASNEQVDIVDMAVDQLEGVDNLGGNQVFQVVKVGGLAITTLFTESIVACNNYNRL